MVGPDSIAPERPARLTFCIGTGNPDVLEHALVQGKQRASLTGDLVLAQQARARHRGEDLQLAAQTAGLPLEAGDMTRTGMLTSSPQVGEVEG